LGIHCAKVCGFHRPEAGAEIADRDAAWKELTGVCSTIAGGISRKLKQDSEWQMELLDEAKKPVFRIRIVAESLDQAREAFAGRPLHQRAQVGGHIFASRARQPVAADSKHGAGRYGV
jgi:hypothetical protein